MTEMIFVPGEMKHEADLRQHDPLKEFLMLEEESGALDIVLWMRIVGCLGDIAPGDAEKFLGTSLFLGR